MIRNKLDEEPTIGKEDVRLIFDDGTNKIVRTFETTRCRVSCVGISEEVFLKLDEIAKSLGGKPYIEVDMKVVPGLAQKYGKRDVMINLATQGSVEFADGAFTITQQSNNRVRITFH